MEKQQNPVVETRSGKLEGTCEGGLFIFKGIPYAAPPVGELRWLAPQPLKPWDQIRSARQFGAIAPQSPPMLEIIKKVPQPLSEDCLFLNIWTPGLDDMKRPVMVWIHGGAFIEGSGSDPTNYSEQLPVRGNIVMVTLNYRLGMLGFLRLKDATDGCIPASGNEGLLDQIAALRWIKENIAAFGGNPDNITIFGESAGSMSVACLMVMPAARGLFQKCILESGAGSVAVPVEEANRCAELFLKFAGIDKHDSGALQSIPPARLLEIEKQIREVMPGVSGKAKVTNNYPVTDGDLIPDFPAKLAQQGYARGIQSIIGTNLDENALFATLEPGFDNIGESEMRQRLKTMLPGEGSGDLIEVYRKSLVKRGMTPSPANILSAICTDLMFRMPALDLVEAQRDNRTAVYNYLFTWESPFWGGRLKACHSLEIGFVLGNYDPAFCGSGEQAEKLRIAMQDAWLAFARTGDPSCQSMGIWPEYGSRRFTMMIGQNNHVESAPFEVERAVWEKIERFDSLVI